MKNSIRIVKCQEAKEKILDPRKCDQCGINADKTSTKPKFT